MRPLAVLFLAAIVGLFTNQFYATAAPSPKPEPSFQLVGFTQSTHVGDDGLLGFSAACQDEFGPGTRICRTDEVAETTALPVGIDPLARAHIRPDLMPTGLDSTTRISSLTCTGWTLSSSSHTGFAVTGRGAFLNVACNTPMSVACCGLVP